MDAFNQALGCFAIVTIVLGLSWILVERLWLSSPLVALAAGIAFGPSGINSLRPAEIGSHVLMEELTRITLALSLVAIALTLPHKYFKAHWKSLAVLLLPGMILMWVASTAVLYVAGVSSFVVALMIAACVTPTDPVVASAIVTGQLAEEYIPARLRNLLKAESAANDGLAYLFVLLPILLMGSSSNGRAFTQWLTTVLIYEVMGAVVIGAVIGFVTGKLQLLGERINTTEEKGLLALSIGMTFTVLTLAKEAGTNDVLAVFVAGVAFHWVAHDRLEGMEALLQDVIQRFFQLPVFVLLGAMLPWREWSAVSVFSATIIIAGLLLVRRIPFWLFLYRFIPEMRSRSDAWFLGWFGPIGVSALFYGCLCRRETGNEQTWILITLIVVASTMAHGITSTPLSRLLHKQYTTKSLKRE